jgi:hypothetical protein
MKDYDLDLLKVNTFDGKRERGVGKFIPNEENSPISQPIDKSSFKNYINEVVDGYSVKLQNNYWNYFLIELNMPYHYSAVSDMIKTLNLDIKSIISPEKILVRGNKETLKFYLTKTIHKKVTNVIANISAVNPNQKISMALQKLLRYDVERKNSYNIFIKFIENLDLDEFNENRNALARKLNKTIQELDVYNNLRAITTSSSVNDILEIAKMPFVKLISKNPDIEDLKEVFEMRSEEKFANYDDLKIIKKICYDTPICIIDSGVSPVLNDFVIKNGSHNFSNENETIPHGSMVGSVAIFGNSLLSKSKELIGTNEIISYKIDDFHENPNNEAKLVEGSINAINKYKDLTPVFNLSYNYMDIDPALRRELVKDLDRKIQENNVSLVISAGNIDENFIFNNITRYPDYLFENNVYCPADTRNSITVGSVDFKGEVSKFSRMLVNPIFINEEIDSFEFFKPEILTLGGNYISDKKLEIDKMNSFPVMVSTGDLYYGVGSSYSAPLIAKSLSILYSKYKHEFKNSETYKAMLLNNSFFSNLRNHSFFKLMNPENVSISKNSILINFEGEVNPHVKAENKNDTLIIECKKIRFYVPNEAKSFRVVIVHSNNYKHNTPEEHLTKVTCKFKKPKKYWKNKEILVSKKYGTMSRYHTTTYGQYEFSRNYEGVWEAEVHMEARKIPKTEFSNIKVRFGISINIELKDEFKPLAKVIHDKVKSENKHAFEEFTQEETIINISSNSSEESIKSHN